MSHLRAMPFALLLAAMSVGCLPPAACGESPPVDAATLRGKVLTGYQGWFRCPGDGTKDGWRHWSRDGRTISAKTTTFEMWPDMTDYSPEEKFVAGDFLFANGAPATLFSSAHAKTVERHFEWMRDYELDGVFLQRFLVSLGESNDRVLANVRAAAEKTGRVYAIGYDLSGLPREKLVETLKTDWRRLTEELKVTQDKTYLHHDGRPVVFVWGFFSDRFSAETAHGLIDIFHRGEAKTVTLIGGCPWYWRREKDAEWARALRRFDVLSPWNVGNYHTLDGTKYAATASWKDDMAEADRAGMKFMPVIYPGFGWTNLQGKSAEGQTIPRLRGEFFRRQFAAAAALRVETAYVAMFDEVDEGTAVFKVTNDPPTPGKFATYEGLPSDHYLRLTRDGTQAIRGALPAAPRPAAP